MNNIKKIANWAAMDFSLQWQSPYGKHQDRRFAEKVDFWRDFFPGSMQEKLPELSPGDKYMESFGAGLLVPEYSHKNVIEFPKTLFTQEQDGILTAPEPGRFYPKSYAWKALNTFPNDTTPFRLVEAYEKTLVADTNHPLAKYPIVVEVTMEDFLKSSTQRGGTSNDITELLTKNGPGMQVPGKGCESSPYKGYPLRRNIEEDDKEFYRSPRFVHHLDRTARLHVQSTYSRLLSSGMRVLDLMSSWESHLPDNLRDCEITGVGLIREELKSNKQLSGFIVQDLNKNPLLPYSGQRFDAAICTVSIEYLVRPREVIAEVARILRPGGIFVVITSDRWFPGKLIIPWADLHPFERQGLVLNYFLHEKGFMELRTESLRGYPRPAEDEYSNQMALSDSLFVVSGRKS